MRHSIRTRLIITFIALSVIPLIAVGAIIGSQTFNAQSQQALALQQSIASREGDLTINFFQKLEDMLKSAITDRKLRDAEPRQQQLILSALLAKQSAFDSVYLLDANGQEQIGVSRNAPIATSDLVSRAEADEFKLPFANNKIYYSAVYTDARTGEPQVTIGIPVQDLLSGNIVNVLVAHLRFVAIQDLFIANENLANTKTSGSSTFYLVDSKNRVVAHSDPAVSLRTTTFVPPAEGGIVAGLKGEQAVLATQNIQLGDQKFSVVAETPLSEALSLANSTVTSIAILVVVALVAATLIGLGVVNQIVRPILSLATTAQAIQNGDYSKQAEAGRKDEIGKMAQAFNSMTTQLRQSLQGLQDHVAELEKAKVEREKLIKDLQAAKRLAEENSRLKSEFLSTMSHELRTPLNAIEGFTGIILNKLGGTDYNAKAESYLTRIRSNSKRLLQLINDFLDLSRVEAGRLDLANQPFSPAQLATRWRDEISVLAEKKGLAFEVSLDSALPPMVYGDEEALSKIVLNMLSNAIKFTEKGQVRLALECDDASWGITVEDTGIGIPPHAREFIFEEFRQVDQSSKRKYGGTGLGLAIAQKYTRAMGGTVNVKSDLGKGSTFTVSLPLRTTPN